MDAKELAYYRCHRIETVDGEWRRPVVVNGWGSDAYYLWAWKSSMGTWGHEDQEDDARISIGDRLDVRWPDGRETTETVAGKLTRNYVSDHGHVSEVDSDTLFVVVNFKGCPTAVPLTSLWVKRYMEKAE